MDDTTFDRTSMDTGGKGFYDKSIGNEAISTATAWCLGTITAYLDRYYGRMRSITALTAVWKEVLVFMHWSYAAGHTGTG